MENKCQGFFGWLFGHKYQARYDSWRKSGPSTITKANAYNFADLLEASKAKEEKDAYIYDVCVRCGCKIKRD